MRIYRKEKRTSEWDILASIECDWCHEHFKTENDFNGVRDSYDKKEFTLEWEEGTNYPEGGNSETEEVELCSVCRTKLKKVVFELGISIHKHNADW
jgi:hypothetical protein